MLECLLQSRPAVSTSLVMVRGTRKPPPPDLSPSEWDVVAEILAFFLPFRNLIEFVSAQRHPTMSYMIRLYAHVLELTRDDEERQELPSVRSMRQQTHQDLAG